MTLESLLIAILICCAITPVLAVMGRLRPGYRVIVGTVVALWLVLPVAIVVTAVSNSSEESPEFSVTNRPVQIASDGYVGAESCRSCHPHQHATWQESYHRTMTQVAHPDRVLGDFDGVELPGHGGMFRLRRESDSLWVEHYPTASSTERQAAPAARPIVLTTGSHHMQAYWFSLQDDSRLLGMLPFVYLREPQRWIPLGASFLQPHGAGEGFEVGRWNSSCVACHTTHGKMGIATTAERFTQDIRLADTRAAEFGISCEACHGPGQQHVDANRDPMRRYAYHLGEEGDQTITNPLRLSHRASSQVCGQCHAVSLFNDDQTWSQWSVGGYDYRPGDELHESPIRLIVRAGDHSWDDRLLEQLERDPRYVTDRFWSDGMIRVTGREYNGLIESPCFQRGELSCLSCHTMHLPEDDPRSTLEWSDDQLKIGMRGNVACLQCHDEYQDKDRLTEHTHHSAESSGSSCYNCHMPHTTYGLLKAIRSHQITVPRVEDTLRTGRPHACNQCHLDKTLGWTADYLSDWYAMPRPELSSDEETIAASVLWLLRGDAGQRALMAWSYGWESAQEVSGMDWLAPYLAQLLVDPYDAVRLMADRSLRGLDGFADFKYPLMGSPDEQQLAYKRASLMWKAQRADRSGAGRDSVLLDEQGDLRRTKFEQLLSERDDQPISLAE